MKYDREYKRLTDMQNQTTNDVALAISRISYGGIKEPLQLVRTIYGASLEVLSMQYDAHYRCAVEAEWDREPDPRALMAINAAIAEGRL